MLFQPTNILPDVINGVGNGTVDVRDGLTVSWQVNGNSLMTAYKVAVFTNNTASTKLYETGRVGITGGFSGVDYQGNIQRFTADTIPYSTLSANGITNGHQYKIKVLEYYIGSDGTETNVQQRSMSVFYARKDPSLTWGTGATGKVAYREATIYANFSQANGDTLSWARWQLYNTTGETADDLTEKNLIADTGNLYGVTELRFDTNSLLNNNNYVLVLTIETSMGVQKTIKHNFIAQWQTKILENAGTALANRVNKQSTAINVSWSGYRYIRGKKNGDVSIQNGTATIGNNSSIVWDETNGGEGLDLQSPWIFVMKTQLNGANVQPLLYLQDTDQEVAYLEYGLRQRMLGYSMLGGDSGTFTGIDYNETLTIMIIPPTEDHVMSRMLIRREGEFGRLVPYQGGYVPTIASAGTMGEVTEEGTVTEYEITVNTEFYLVDRILVRATLSTAATSGNTISLNVNDTGTYPVRYQNENWMASGLDTTRQYLFIFHADSQSPYYEMLWPIETTGLFPDTTLPPNEERIPYVVLETVNLHTFLPEPIDSVTVGGSQKVDYVQIINGDDYVTDEVINDLIDSAYVKGDYDPEEDVLDGSDFLAAFTNLGSADAGQFTIGGEQVVGWAIYRENERDNTAIHLLDTENIAQDHLYDYGCGSGRGRYRYWIYPMNTNRSYITNGIVTRWINPVFENWSIIEAVESTDEHYTLFEVDGGYFKVLNEYVFGKNLKSGSVGNNNSPTVSQNFTRYATVQMSNVNYQSGTLTSLIGHIGYFSYVIQNGDSLSEIAIRFGTTADKIIQDNSSLTDSGTLPVGEIIRVFYTTGLTDYRDDIELRDDIWKLSVTENPLFLKSRKGDVIRIKISGEISMETADESVYQQLTVSIPWVQIGEAKRARIIGGTF